MNLIYGRIIALANEIFHLVQIINFYFTTFNYSNGHLIKTWIR